MTTTGPESLAARIGLEDSLGTYTTVLLRGASPAFSNSPQEALEVQDKALENLAKNAIAADCLFVANMIPDHVTHHGYIAVYRGTGFKKD